MKYNETSPEFLMMYITIYIGYRKSIQQQQ
jgi:hypothetical protein